MKLPTTLAGCMAFATLIVRAADTTPPPPAAAPAVPLKLLVEAAQAAIASCSAAGWPVAVTVMDPDLTPRLMLRADGAGKGVVDISRRKAYTVIKTGMSSGDFAKTLPSEVASAPESQPVNGDPELIARAGGVPILLNGKMVGAIGVSGRPRGADVDCANAGLARISGVGK